MFFKTERLKDERGGGQAGLAVLKLLPLVLLAKRQQRKWGAGAPLKKEGTEQSFTSHGSPELEGQKV